MVQVVVELSHFCRILANIAFNCRDGLALYSFNNPNMSAVNSSRKYNKVSGFGKLRSLTTVIVPVRSRRAKIMFVRSAPKSHPRYKRGTPRDVFAPCIKFNNRAFVVSILFSLPQLRAGNLDKGLWGWFLRERTTWDKEEREDDGGLAPQHVLDALFVPGSFTSSKLRMRLLLCPFREALRYSLEEASSLLGPALGYQSLDVLHERGCHLISPFTGLMASKTAS